MDFFTSPNQILLDWGLGLVVFGTECYKDKVYTKVIIFWLENGKFEFSRKQYIFLKHSKREFCAEFYYHF